MVSHLKFFGLIGAALCLAACAAPLEQTVLSIANSDCASCGAMMAEELADMPDIEKADYDATEVEVTAYHKPGTVTGKELIERLDWLNYDIRLGSGQGSYMSIRAFKESLDVKIIVEDGNAVELREHLVLGKVTVVDFFAEWCGPCRKIDELMEEILLHNPDVAFRKVNIVDWDSPAAKQHLANASNIPHVMVFTPSGRLLTEISGVKRDELKEAIERARSPQ